MKYVIKTMLFLIVEYYFYAKISVAGRESFFFFWAFFFLALLLYNVFSIVFGTGGMSVAGGGKGNIVNVQEQHNRNIENGHLGKGVSGLKDKGNLIYVALFILNVIGYIQVMPK